jgi:hypothetical protein
LLYKVVVPELVVEGFAGHLDLLLALTSE